MSQSPVETQTHDAHPRQPLPRGRLTLAACLAGLRILAAGWIGAAVLFVITSVTEQTSPHFDSVTRDHLAAVRFPAYYALGFVIHAMCFCLAGLACLAGGRRALRVVLGLVVVSGVLILLDFFFVYQPLLDAITPAGKARPAEFHDLHTLSRHANEAHLSVMFAVAIIVCILQTGSTQGADSVS